MAGAWYDMTSYIYMWTYHGKLEAKFMYVVTN